MAQIRQRAFPPGVYRGVPYSRERLRDFIDGTNKAISLGVSIPLLDIHAPIDCDDKTTQQFSGSQGRGWLTKLEQDPTDGAVVFHADKVPDDTAKAIQDGTLRLTSPEIRHKYKSDDGRYEGPILRHFAFTPKSGTTKQGPIEVMALSEIPTMQLSEDDYEPFETVQLTERSESDPVAEKHGYKYSHSTGGSGNFGGEHVYVHPEGHQLHVGRKMGETQGHGWQHYPKKSYVNKSGMLTSHSSGDDVKGMARHLAEFHSSSQHAETTQHADYGDIHRDSMHGVLKDHGYTPRKNNAFEYEHKGGNHRVILNGYGGWHYSMGTRTGSPKVEMLGHGKTELHKQLKSVHGESSQHAESTDTILAPGTKVHLGFGSKGGAGFRGTVKKHEGSTVHIESPDGKTYKGPHRFVTVESGATSQHAEPVPETEQFADGPTFHRVLDVHGYEKVRPGEYVRKGVSRSGQKTRHAVRFYPDRGWHHHGDDLKMTKGHGAGDLEKHLSFTHSSQHTEPAMATEPITETPAVEVTSQHAEAHEIAAIPKMMESHGWKKQTEQGGIHTYAHPDHGGHVMHVHPSGVWGHENYKGHTLASGAHGNLAAHLAHFPKSEIASQHAEEPPPKKIDEPKADESSEKPPVEPIAEGPAAANPDMPPVATDKSKLAAFVAGMAQLGVVLNSDFDFSDPEKALDLLIVGINTQCKAIADAESEPEEPKEPTDTEANPTWAFSEAEQAELDALPPKAKAAYEFAVKARQEQQAKAAQFAEEARTLAEQKAQLARDKAVESIKGLKMMPGLRNKLLDMLAPGTAQFTDQGEQPTLTVQQVAVLIMETIPPAMQLSEKDGVDAEHPDTKQFFEANKIVQPGTEGRPQTREEAKSLLTKIDQEMGMRPTPKTAA